MCRYWKLEVFLSCKCFWQYFEDFSYGGFAVWTHLWKKSRWKLALLQPCMFTLWLYFRFQLSYEQVWKTSNPAAKQKTAKAANSCLTNYNLLRNFCVFLKINRLIASVQFAKFSTDQLSLSIFLPEKRRFSQLLLKFMLLYVKANTYFLFVLKYFWRTGRHYFEAEFVSHTQARYL